MKRGSQLAAACLFGLFAAAFVGALDFPLLDDLGPGPGFFPLWLGVAGAGLSLALFIEASRAPADAAAQALLPGRDGRTRALAVLGFLVAAAALMEPLGYRLTMLVFIAGLLVALGVRGPVGITVVALAGSFGVFHVFYHWLKVPLPVGQLGL